MGYIFDAMSRGRDESGAAGGSGAAQRDVAATPAAEEAPVGQPITPPAPPPAPARDLSLVTAALDRAAATRSAASAPGAPAEPVAETAPGRRQACDDRLVAWSEPASLMAEEYRSIRTALLARVQQRRHLIHTITSATPQEGKTLTSLNLGAIFAELRNRRTIVVEADLRLPQFAKLLKLEVSPGLVGVLQQQATLDDAITRIAGSSLHLLPAGQRVNDQAVQLLSSTAMADLLKLLRQRYDHVILDTPPVVELADAGILGALSDQVLLVARMQRTPRTLIEQAVRTLTSYNARVAGVIATDQQRRHGRYYFRYGYRYGYQSRYAKAA